ncbi:MAG: SUF system NifU family Fe-S cluster assembly protein [Dehalococcoidia bacterium]
MQSDELDDLYREVILDHYRKPRNRQLVENAEIQSEGNNPFCGDDVALQLKLNGSGTIQDIGFQGRGCSISQASVSMLTEAIKGKTLEEAEALNKTFRRLMRGEELDDADMEALGDLSALQGVCKFPVRIKCALLAWTTLEEGVEKHLEREG